ncbi:MAG: permease, partial [Dermatophilaceae bacterium]
MLAEVEWFVRFTIDAILELAPWFLAAIGLGVLIQHLNLDMLATRAFRRHGVLGVVLSAAVGALSPFCSFTVIPLVTRLLRSGVPLSVIMAFWIASPAMDPEIFALSAAALGTDVAVARLLGAIALSVGSGLLVLAIERQGGFRDVLVRRAGPADQRGAAPANVPAPAAMLATPSAGMTTTAPVPAPDSRASATSSTEPEPWDGDDGRRWHLVIREHTRDVNWRRFARDVLRDTGSLGKWLLLAVVLQAAIVRYVPQDWVISALGTADWWSVPAAALVGV